MPGFFPPQPLPLGAAERIEHVPSHTRSAGTAPRPDPEKVLDVSVTAIKLTGQTSPWLYSLTGPSPSREPRHHLLGSREVP